MAFVGCSNWIAKCVKESQILRKSQKIYSIPNPVAPGFYPYNDSKVMALRNKYGLNPKDKVLLIGAMAIDDYRKGGQFIKEISKKICNLGYKLLLFGSHNIQGLENTDSILYLGKCDLEEMKELYNIADGFLALSVQENLANTVMESLSCGTPVVAFDIGGISDMIIHSINGYLAKPFSLDEIIQGVDYCRHSLKFNKYEISEDINIRFSADSVSKKYLSVYKTLMESDKNLYQECLE